MRMSGGSLDFLQALSHGLPLDPLPAHPGRDASVPHAPKRAPKLSKGRLQVCIKAVAVWVVG